MRPIDNPSPNDDHPLGPPQELSEFLANPFHEAALVAYVEQAVEEQTWPTLDATRQRANRLYEAELASRRHK